MIKKFLIYCKSDGIKDALVYAWKTILSLFFIKSRTCFFKLKDFSVCDFLCDDCEIKKIEKHEVDVIDFPRLMLLPVNKWLNSGSFLYVTYDGDKPIAFTWTHKGNYEIHGLGSFDLGDNERWIGPTFVCKEYRGRGLNKKQIAYQITEALDKTYYTSVNSGNIASLASFKRLGFVEFGETLNKKLFFRKSFVVNGDELKNRIIK